MAKKKIDTVDFNIEVPDYVAPERQPQMMHSPQNMRDRTYKAEEQLQMVTVAFELLMLEVQSNRRQIQEMQEQLKTIAKG